MADFPHDRVSPDEPPFTGAGVDCFGPFEIKHGRNMIKRCGVNFTGCESCTLGGAAILGYGFLCPCPQTLRGKMRSSAGVAVRQWDELHRGRAQTERGNRKMEPCADQ